MNTRTSSILILAAALSAPVLSLANDQDPKAVSQISPAYPFELLKSRIPGEILVEFTITANGDVTNAAVVQSTDRAFEEPTLKAVRKWKFTPPVRDGVPVARRAMQLVSYSVVEPDSEPATAIIGTNLKPNSSANIIASK